jgi:hypothetical protein
LLSEWFDAYPPQARQVARDASGLLKTLPVAFAQLLLQQIEAYDWRFPIERREIDRQLAFLESLSVAERSALLSGFGHLRLSPELALIDWSKSPDEYSEQLSAYLWSTHQIDAFHEAATTYLTKFHAANPPIQATAPRLGIAVIGKGVEKSSSPLFRKLRAHGTYFSHIDPTNGLNTLLGAAVARATTYPESFAHWYIDGGRPETVSNRSLVTLSYAELDPVRKLLLSKIDKAIRNGIPGPEAMLTMLHKLRPDEIGLSNGINSAVLDYFKASLLLSGSGTQIFSTSFVQWATRELWRRAQPLTILARFSPRQRQRPMNDMLTGDEPKIQLDPAGSLIDADMAAFYMWLDQQRLPGAEQASFLVWFENHNEALLIAPGLPRNAQSNNPVTMRWLIEQLS